jgi:hypothetical protein
MRLILGWFAAVASLVTFLAAPRLALLAEVR